MRLDRDSFKEILDTLTRNKSRSLLTGFGVFWGLFMLLVMIGGGNGLNSILAQTFEGFATNTLIMVSQKTTKPFKGMKEGRSWDLTFNDIKRLKTMVPELDVVTPMISRWGQKAVLDNKTADCALKGIEAQYGLIETPQIKYGRYLNENDIVQGRKVCVIGKRVYEALFPEGGDPCGNSIKVGSTYFKIAGVDFNSGNFSINGKVSQSVVIPISVARKLFNTGEDVDVICTTGKKGVVMSSLNRKLRMVIAKEHLFDPSDEQAMMLINTEQLFSVMDNLFKGLDFLIWLVGLGTLLAGVIGVSNIMMVTVRERTTEIGIRRAIGATPKDIITQIMMESVSLTLVSGMSGIVLAVLVLSGLDTAKPDCGFQIPFWTAIGAALMLSVLGAVAGLAPMSRAMGIKPVDAMRDE